MYKHTLLIKLRCFLEDFSFITFYSLGVRKETNLPLEVLEMFVGLVTLVLVR